MKGIAIETILLLLLGILVAGILVFLLYKYVFNRVLPLELCASMAINWCTLCKNAYPDFQCEPNCYVPVGPDLSECAREYFGGVPSNCADGECCHNAGTWCAVFIQTH